MADLTDLIARCENAGESEQRHMLELAWQELHNEFPSTVEWANQPAFRFARMLNAEAYLSAAEMLVPEGRKWSIGPGRRQSFKIGGTRFANLIKTTSECEAEWFWRALVFGHDGSASTPALALLAASLRAMEKQG